jgi:hypothetical protein
MTDKPQGLTAEEIFAIDDLKIEPVIVPFWSKDKPVYVRTITSGERADLEYELFVAEEKLKQNDADYRKWVMMRFKERFLFRVCVTADGARLFKDEDAITQLSKKNAGAVDYLYEKAREINRISEADIEELAKNSASSQSGDSSTS